MIYKPYDYQEFATNFIVKNEEAAIFLDCGLGKTVITLTAIKRLIDLGEIKNTVIDIPVVMFSEKL